ncbi:ATP-dependent Clp protease ATP-binding subunit [Candidatus Peregrinibacteria bacterium]|nr:MAG: ATP-dependent Clp protease ATP-binding subunit [Candidatus Peregrinibacteria bacterium]
MRGSIDSEDIARVISRMTGVPVTKLVKEDTDRLKDLENIMKNRVIGQEEAIEKVARAIRRSRTGISSGKRPIASFIFLGPTGVGKTELVKTIAKEVYNDEEALIKIDMSEFMERHNTSRLTGTTAGYVGYEDGGQLTEKVRRKPYSVILFDEIEKAHTDVFNIFASNFRRRSSHRWKRPQSGLHQHHHCDDFQHWSSQTHRRSRSYRIQDQFRGHGRGHARF